MNDSETSGAHLRVLAVLLFRLDPTLAIRLDHQFQCSGLRLSSRSRNTKVVKCMGRARTLEDMCARAIGHLRL